MTYDTWYSEHGFTGLESGGMGVGWGSVGCTERVSNAVGNVLGQCLVAVQIFCIFLRRIFYRREASNNGVLSMV